MRDEEYKKLNLKKPGTEWFDIDDTILANDGSFPLTPREHAVEYIKQRIRHGIEVNFMSARGSNWCRYVAKELGTEGVNAFLTKPKSKHVYDDKPHRLAKRFNNARPLLSGDDWYQLGMKYLRWKKQFQK